MASPCGKLNFDVKRGLKDLLNQQLVKENFLGVTCLLPGLLPRWKSAGLGILFVLARPYWFRRPRKHVLLFVAGGEYGCN